MTAQELSRRLITLIFAGRNRMDMIRRELPRTERAGWGRSPFRIEHKEGSPFRVPCAVIGSAVQENIFVVVLGRSCELLLFLPCSSDRPDEAEQLTPDRRHDLVLVLAARGERFCSACAADVALSRRSVSLRR